jgi:hypothetical protein
MANGKGQSSKGGNWKREKGKGASDHFPVSNFHLPVFRHLPFALLLVFLCSSLVTRHSALLFCQNHYTAAPGETLAAASDGLAVQGVRPAVWALKNQAYVQASGASVSTPAFSSALTNPSIIVVGIWIDPAVGSVPAPTDTAGNTYILPLDSGLTS